MKIKKINTVITILCVIILIYPSCDIVEQPYLTDDNPINPSTGNKKVLIEKFTGHNCKNCPSAATALEALQNLYPENLIGISIHPDILSFTAPHASTGQYSYDFRTKWGKEMGETFSVSNLPTGMVNRIGKEDNTHLLDHNDWLDIIQSEIEKEAIFEINLSSNIANDNENISVEVTALDNFSGEYNIVLCLIEDSIINWQLQDNEDIESYQHDHVLRAVLNTALGDNIGSSFQNEDICWSEEYPVDLNALEQYNIDYSQNNLVAGNGNCGGWVADNMGVVAYIYNVSTEEIVQAEEIHLTNH